MELEADADRVLALAAVAFAVALVPMVDAGHVCLIKNHRYAIDRTLLEVPAGTNLPNGKTVQENTLFPVVSGRYDASDPSIELIPGGYVPETLEIASWMLEPGEAEIVGDRIAEILDQA